MTQYKDFYPFFFTHIEQEVSPTTVGPWVEIERPAQNVLTINDNLISNVYFQVSGYQPKGTLSFLVQEGEYPLDCSSSMSISNSQVLTSSTLQPITDYLSTISTPINPPYLNRKFNYVYAKDNGIPIAFERVYPNSVLDNRITGKYPDQVVIAAQKIENPWLVESSALLSSFVEEGSYVYAELTVDTSSITIDQSNLSNYGSSLLTTDRTTYVRLAVNDDSTYLDLSPDLSSPKKVTLEQNPIGLGILDWSVEGNSISKTWVPSPNRGYLPSDTLSKSMKGADLKSVALGLIGLIAHKDDDLIASVLEEICYIWSSLKLKHPNIKGLPSFLPRVFSDNELTGASTKRKTSDQAWIGVALVKCIRFLRDRTVVNLVDLPLLLDSLLEDLVLSVTSAIDETTSTVYVGYDEDGYVIDELDLSAGYISQLFLHSLLPVNYSTDAHGKAAFLFLDIEKQLQVNEDDLVYLQYGQSLGEVVVEKLFWNVSNNLHASSKDLCNQIDLFLQSTDLSSFHYGLLDYLLPYIPDTGNLSLGFKDIEDKTHYISSGVYTYKNRNSNKYPEPDLCASTWMRIKIINFNILPALDFDIYADGSRLFLSEQYQEALRMMPFGYGWASENAESAYNGKLGALLYSCVFPSFVWFLSLELVNNGIHLLSAQAWTLDEWGYSLNRERPKYQSDTFFRSTLFFNKNKLQGTKLGLLQLVQSLYSEKVEFDEPVMRSLEYLGVQTPWSNNPALINSLSDATQVVIDRPRYPTSSIAFIGSTQTVPWQSCAATLNVYTDQFLPSIEEEIMSNTSAGVEANIFVCDFNHHKITTFAG